MSTATTSHHHFPGATAAAAIACAVVLAGGAALGIALTNSNDSAQPVAPTTECTSASCAVTHPVLPGRHDFKKDFRDGQLRKHAGGFQSTTSGGQTMVGQ